MGGNIIVNNAKGEVHFHFHGAMPGMTTPHARGHDDDDEEHEHDAHDNDEEHEAPPARPAVRKAPKQAATKKAAAREAADSDKKIN
jgi:hypothetical protein